MAYLRAFRQFDTWCLSKGIGLYPLQPFVVAAYTKELKETHRPPADQTRRARASICIAEKASDCGEASFLYSAPKAANASSSSLIPTRASQSRLVSEQGCQASFRGANPRLEMRPGVHLSGKSSCGTFLKMVIFSEAKLLTLDTTEGRRLLPALVERMVTDTIEQRDLWWTFDSLRLLVRETAVQSR